MISGCSVSLAVACGANCLEELMSSLDGIVQVSNPRRDYPMSPVVIAREGFVSFGKDVFDPHPFRQGFLLVWHAHTFFFCCPLLGGRRGWILVLQASFPVMRWFTSWRGGSLGLLEDEVDVFVIGNHDLRYLLPSLVKGFTLGDLPFARCYLRGHTHIVRWTLCL